MHDVGELFCGDGDQLEKLGFEGIPREVLRHVKNWEFTCNVLSELPEGPTSSGDWVREEPDMIVDAFFGEGVVAEAQDSCFERFHVRLCLGKVGVVLEGILELEGVGLVDLSVFEAGCKLIIG